MKPHVFHPAADEEYTRAVEYYRSIRPGLAAAFFGEMERLIREVCSQPERFFLFSPPARRALSRRFPYSVVYLDQPDRVWIVALMHGNRELGYWKGRLE